MTKLKKYSAMLLLLLGISSLFLGVSAKNYYQLKIYTIKNKDQETRMDNYLEKACIPALHRAGIKDVGVFKTIEGSNGDLNQIIVFIPMKSLKQFDKINTMLEKDAGYMDFSKEFRGAAYDNPPYERMESTLLSSFIIKPEYSVPEMMPPKSDRIYELRSYESTTEELHKKKVQMFNNGEAGIFTELGFQPIFFGDVISGAHMPNLIYFICHENEEAQAKNWEAFGKHPLWNEMKAMDEYQNTVSHIDKWLLYPTDYSEI